MLAVSWCVLVTALRFDNEAPSGHELAARNSRAPRVALFHCKTNIAAVLHMEAGPNL